MEDRLDGAGNFMPSKARIMLILEENELWDEVVHNTTAVPIVIPPTIDATALTAFNNKDIKARRIILDVVEDVSFSQFQPPGFNVKFSKFNAQPKFNVDLKLHNNFQRNKTLLKLTFNDRI